MKLPSVNWGSMTVHVDLDNGAHLNEARYKHRNFQPEYSTQIFIPNIQYEIFVFRFRRSTMSTLHDLRGFNPFTC